MNTRDSVAAIYLVGLRKSPKVWQPNDDVHGLRGERLAQTFSWAGDFRREVVSYVWSLRLSSLKAIMQTC